jgi:CheY-like chemotaxis protein
MMTTHELNRPIEILLVEDNPGDVRLTQEALKDAKISNTVNVTRDGVDAMAFLRRQDGYADAPIPDLILLDLNLPRRSGFEVLEDLKKSPDLKRIPVVILTSSGAEQDVLSTYDLQANCYITKPVDLEQFLNVIRVIEEFWLTIVRLPNGGLHGAS